MATEEPGPRARSSGQAEAEAEDEAEPFLDPKYSAEPADMGFVMWGEAANSLEAFAKSRGIEPRRALGNALALQMHLADAVNKGGKVLIERADGTFSLVMLP